MANNVYDNRREVYVIPFSGTDVKYGFLTNVLESVGTSCGHEPVDRANAPVGLCFGANAPKPGRASKRRTSGTDSTYYSIGNVASLRAGGWSLTPPTIRRASSKSNSHAVYVTLGGIKYAWNMPIHTYNKTAAVRAELGIEDATSTSRDLVWGASYPKPPRASQHTAGTDGSDTVSTFVDPSFVDELPAGWSVSNREKVLS